MKQPGTVLAKYIDYWETLSIEAVARLAQFYTEDAYFRDPFNEVRGVAAITHVFEDMFERLHEPRFHIIETVSEFDSAFLIWDFAFRIKSFRPRVARVIRGTTHVRFAEDGRVTYHRDYWDAASELYEHLPFIGGLLRRLRRRIA